ncbi:tRNA pseudouridine(38-40) synthase TruA, partial [bacterium]|nr:tRNA pseudouridine(38-40) synthase TruA [bacterium]MBU1025742.1 tRNA pseudouridine(38-40) synthase TruA [bacterium]
MPIKNIMGVVEYDGTDFEGFQIQPEGHRTVQEEITRTLEKIVGHPVKVNGASRTDAGVHATGQVIAFKTSASRTLENIINSTNSLSPGDWRIEKMAEVSWDFHPRYNATGKTYVYLIDRVNSVLRRRYSWGMINDLEVSMMRTAADIIIGEHDFRSFTTLSAHENDVTVRRID